MLVPATETNWPATRTRGTRVTRARLRSRRVCWLSLTVEARPRRESCAQVIRACAYLRGRDSVRIPRAATTCWRCASRARRSGRRNAAVRTFVRRARARPRTQPWQRLVAERAAGLDLAPLLAVQPLRGFMPGLPDAAAEEAARPVCASSSPRSARRRRRRSRASCGAAGRPWRTSATAGSSTACSPTPPRRATCSPHGSTRRGRARRAVLGAHQDAARPRHRAALPHARAARPPPRPRRAPSAHPLDEARPLVRRTAAAVTVEVDERGLVLMPSAYHAVAQGRRGRRRAVAADDRLSRARRRRPLAGADRAAGRPGAPARADAARSFSRASTGRSRRRRSPRSSSSARPARRGTCSLCATQGSSRVRGRGTRSGIAGQSWARPCSSGGMPHDRRGGYAARGNGRRISGRRGACVKSKSLTRFPRIGSASRTSGRGSGRPSVCGSRRWPPRKSSSMNFA